MARKYETRQAARRGRWHAKREREAAKRAGLSDAEKRTRRLEHAERIRQALEALETEAGFAAFLEARELNPHLTPLSVALAAWQAPGAIVGTYPYWRKLGASIRKGESAVCFLTATGFWPQPAFALEQTTAAPLEGFEPAIPPAQVQRAMLEALRAMFGADGRKTKTLNAYAETLPAAGAELENGSAAGASSAELESFTEAMERVPF